MKITVIVQVIVVLGLSLLGVFQLVTTGRSLVTSPPSVTQLTLTSPRSPSQKALRAARAYRLGARRAVKDEREALLEIASPEIATLLDTEEWRQLLMARDHRGLMHRAQVQARQAAALARTPTEAHEAALLLARIECDMGHHQEELRQARASMALQPKNPDSLVVWHRAAFCCGLERREEPSRSAAGVLLTACKMPGPLGRDDDRGER